MAFARRGGRLNAPKVITFTVSLILVGLAVASQYAHLPAIGPFVAGHRFWMAVAGYILLALGVMLPGI